MIVSKKFAHCTSIFKQEYNLFHFEDKPPCLDLMHTFWTDQNCNKFQSKFAGQDDSGPYPTP